MGLLHEMALFVLVVRDITMLVPSSKSSSSNIATKSRPQLAGLTVGGVMWPLREMALLVSVVCDFATLTPSS